MHTDAEITMEMVEDSPRIKAMVPPRKQAEDTRKEALISNTNRWTASWRSGPVTKSSEDAGDP